MISPCYFFHFERPVGVKKTRSALAASLGRHALKKKISIVNLDDLAAFFAKKPKYKKGIVYGFPLEHQVQPEITKLLHKGFELWFPVDTTEEKDEHEREIRLIQYRKAGVLMCSTEFVIKNT